MSDTRGYVNNFYDGRHDRSAESAHRVLSLVFAVLPPVRRVIDYGCGVGTWLAQARRLGACEVHGLEGHWLDRGLLEIDDSEFSHADLTRPARLTPDSRYDLALCLEVIEHLPPENGTACIDLLTASADIVLFSAAIPGQGGKGHLNEQWPDVWTAEFAARGYAVFAPFRRELWTDRRVRPWYRQNLLLCVRHDLVDRIALSAFDRAMPVLPLVHPEIWQAVLETKQAEIDRLRSGRGAWRALRRAMFGA